ncbi:MAG: polysaccharide biosynthesis C-terminal domain-containing protein [Anaerolineae bacterium]|nr:MAG: polysaccharide biosynthesis C-terminal domain-containing protein [Anaerolineae bacterium]
MKISQVLQRLRGDSIAAIFARGAGSAFVVNLTGVALAFGVAVLLARILGAEQYGYYVYALTWVMLLALPSLLGMDTAAVRFIAAYKARGEDSLAAGFFVYSRRFTLYASILLALVLAGVVWWLEDTLVLSLRVTFWVACLLLPIVVRLRLYAALLRGLKKPVAALAPEVLLHPLLLIAVLIIWMTYTGKDPQAATALKANLFSVVLLVILLFLYVRKMFQPLGKLEISRCAKVEWYRTAFPLMLLAGSQVLLSQTDIVMLGFLRGTFDAGIYSAAARLGGLVAFGLVVVNIIVAPLIADLHARKHKQKLQRLVTLSAMAVLLVAVPVSLILFIAGEWVLGLFGTAFTAGYSALLILAVGQLVNALAGSVGFMMTMTGHQREAARILGFTVVLNLFLNGLLIPEFGMPGAAIATASALVFWNVWMLFYVRRQLSIDPSILSLLRRQV